MEQQSTRLRNAGFATFFSAASAPSVRGVVVNLLAGFLIGVLPAASGGAILMRGSWASCRKKQALPLGWPPTSCPAWGWCCSPCWWHACRKNKAEGNKTELVRDRSYGKA